MVTIITVPLSPWILRLPTPKKEEKISLRTRGPLEARKRVRVEAVKAGRRFEKHRKSLSRSISPASKPLAVVNLTLAEQILLISGLYYHSLLEADDEYQTLLFPRFLLFTRRQ